MLRRLGELDHLRFIVPAVPARVRRRRSGCGTASGSTPPPSPV